MLPDDRRDFHVPQALSDLMFGGGEPAPPRRFLPYALYRNNMTEEIECETSEGSARWTAGSPDARVTFKPDPPTDGVRALVADLRTRI
jgi:hypothetical protein